MSGRRLNKGNTGLLLYEVDDLVAVETDKAKVLNALFLSLHQQGPPDLSA